MHHDAYIPQKMYLLRRRMHLTYTVILSKLVYTHSDPTMFFKLGRQLIICQLTLTQDALMWSFSRTRSLTQFR